MGGAGQQIVEDFPKPVPNHRHCRQDTLFAPALFLEENPFHSVVDHLEGIRKSASFAAEKAPIGARRIPKAYSPLASTCPTRP